VAELAGHVDHRSSLVEEERGKRVAQVVWARVLDPGTIERTSERAAPPRLVRRLAPDGPGRRWKDERRVGRHRYELAGRVRLRVVDVPAGTHGFEDLRRGGDLITTPAGIVRVASVVDLLRIADASRSKSAYREAVAYQAVLDVVEARRGPRPQDDCSPAGQIDAALRLRTPIPT